MPFCGAWVLLWHKAVKATAHVRRRSASTSHPQRSEDCCARQFLLARPDEIHALGCGAEVSQRGFLAGARTQESSCGCDVMKTEPFGKPVIWMYQFW